MPDVLCCGEDLCGYNPRPQYRAEGYISINVVYQHKCGICTKLDMIYTMTVWVCYSRFIGIFRSIMSD